MRDKDLQRELWRKSDEFNTLEKVLNVIRASEAAAQNQSAEAGQAVWQPGRPNASASFVTNWATPQRTARRGTKIQSSKTSLKCGFCGGPKRCIVNECKAFEMKCAGCNKFGHFKKCCNAITRAKARE